MNTVKIVSTQNVVVKETETNLIKVRVPTAPATIKISTQGPQGPAGTGYIHTQVTPSATWIINHNLGFRPAVELLDTGGQEIDGEVAHPSINQAVVTLNPATAGLARLT